MGEELTAFLQDLYFRVTGYLFMPEESNFFLLDWIIEALSFMHLKTFIE